MALKSKFHGGYRVRDEFVDAASFASVGVLLIGQSPLPDSFAVFVACASLMCRETGRVALSQSDLAGVVGCTVDDAVRTCTALVRIGALLPVPGPAGFYAVNPRLISHLTGDALADAQRDAPPVARPFTPEFQSAVRAFAAYADA